MKPCIFCGIVAGTTSAAVVYDEGELMAFLDHRPLFPGHVLLIPKSHIGTLAELPQALNAKLLAAAKRISIAVEKALKAEGSFVAINNRVSQSVPHLHVHIVPRTRGDGLKGFFWPRHPYKDEEHMEEVRLGIASAILRAGPQI